MIIEDQYLPILDEIKDNCPHLEKVIEVGDEKPEGDIAFADLMNEGDDTPVDCEADRKTPPIFFILPAPPAIPKGFCCPIKTSWPTPTASTPP